MKSTLLILFILLGLNLSFSQTFEIPDNYTIAKELFGDLDKDGVDERVLVVNTNISENEQIGFKRILYILKKDSSNTEYIWKENSTILWDSKACGFCLDIYDDPLISIQVKRNTLVIKHKMFNNTRRTEEHQQIFRFQNNNWYLIGSTYRYADTCDFDNTYDINFSTNEVIITKITSDCEENEDQKDSYSQITYKHHFGKIAMDNYKNAEVEIQPNIFIVY